MFDLNDNGAIEKHEIVVAIDMLKDQSFEETVNRIII